MTWFARDYKISFREPYRIRIHHYMHQYRILFIVHVIIDEKPSSDDDGREYSIVADVLAFDFPLAYIEHKYCLGEKQNRPIDIP